jgi:hypothetical protein
MPRPAHRLILLLITASLIGGCRSRPSDVDSAKLIQGSEEFRRPKVAHIPRQVFIPDEWSIKQHGQLSITQLARFEPTVAILKLEHHVDVVDQLFPDPRYLAGLHWNHVLTVTPTAALRATVLSPDTKGEFERDRAGVLDQSDVVYAQRTLNLRNVRVTPGWQRRIGERRFERVEAVHGPRDKVADLSPNEIAVDFTWKWHADSASEAFDSEGERFAMLPDSVQYAARDAGVRMNTADPMLSRAILRNTSAGWVVRTITWSFGRGNPR